MKKINSFLLLATVYLASSFLYGQIVTTDPPLPVTNQEVTVIFDATQGNGGLAGYTGDVYAHTGVITEYSVSGSDWKYVKTSWGQNTPETKMTRIGADLYSLQITPTIRGYYGVPEDETILQMAFVFRSATQVGGQWLEGKTETGGDIFVDVSEPGLSITFTQPSTDNLIVELNDEIIIQANANESDSIALYLEEELLGKVSGSQIMDTVYGTEYGKFMLRAVAWTAEETVSDTVYFIVRGEVDIEPLPVGMRDGINYIDQSTVVLTLIAPGKEYVYVLGDFNDWQVDPEFYMNMTPDSTRFWLQVNGLVPLKEYIYQYFVDGQVLVGDPFADKVSDPWNDQYIDEATYPGLIDYPSGKTTGVATVLQTGQSPYDWEVTDFTPPSVTDLVIYELLVRDFTEQHSCQAVIDTLDYLMRLGVNAIELMPVNEFEGNISWGYNPSFYFAPDKYYGPKDKLKKLVDEAHKRGIAVILDIVLNHAYDQCPLVQLYFDGSNPAADNPWFNVQSNFTNPDAQWGNDFNHESLYTQALVDSINSYWMTEYNMDGFRFDFTKGFGNNIKDSSDPWGSNYDADRIRLLKRMADEIWERNDDAIVIFEHLAVNAEDKELAEYGILMWGNMNYNYAEAAMGYNESGKSNFSGISYKSRGWSVPHLVGYMESHDEERLMYKCVTYGNSEGDYNIKDTTTALQRMLLDAVFFLTAPGPKMIWQFGEIGYDISIEYNGRTGPKPVKWDYLENYNRGYLYRFYSSLNALRTAHPTFETTDFTISANTPFKRIKLNHPEMNVVIVGNFDVVPGEVIPDFQHTGTWYEYFTGNSIEVSSTSEPMQLAQGEYRMYTDVRLDPPQLGVGEKGKDPGRAVRIYPNPSDRFTLELEVTDPTVVSIRVFDLMGRMIGSIEPGRLTGGIHTFKWVPSDIVPGAYFLEVLMGETRITKKIIIS